MKRVLSVLLICTLLMAGLASFASAATASIAISVDKESYAVGETVTATVKLNDYDPGTGTWSLMTVAVLYDSAVLQYETATNKLSGGYTGGLQPSNDAVNGVLGLTWIGDTLPAPGADNAVAELTFTVLNASKSSVQLTAFFVEDGMIAQGEKTQMENSDGEGQIYSTAEILSDSITITDGDDPEEPTSNKQTINSNTEPYNEVSFNIAASYKEGGTVPVYHVDITWDNGDIKYTAEGKKWIPSEHDWGSIGTPETAAKWEGNGTIELYNHSCEAVTATFKYTPDGNNTVMEFKQGTTVIDENGISINAPQETQENEPTTDPGYAEVTAAITSGTITGENGATIGLGKLVVTIA